MCVCCCASFQMYTLWVHHRTITSYWWGKRVNLAWSVYNCCEINCELLSFSGLSSKSAKLRKFFSSRKLCATHYGFLFMDLPCICSLCDKDALAEVSNTKLDAKFWQPGINKTGTHLLFFSELICFQGFGLQILLYNKHKEKTSWPRELSFPWDADSIPYWVWFLCSYTLN